MPFKPHPMPKTPPASNAAQLADQSSYGDDERGMLREMQEYLFNEYERFISKQAHRSDESWFTYVLQKQQRACDTINALCTLHGLPERPVIGFRYPDTDDDWNDEEPPF